MKDVILLFQGKSRKIFSSIILILTVAVHIIVLVVVPYYRETMQEREDNTIFKIVDVTEYVPPPPEPEREQEVEKPEDIVEVAMQDTIVEDVIVTEDIVAEVTGLVTGLAEEVEYLPQHKISKAPELPITEIRSRIEYPPMARRQGVEGIVYLLLYIDQFGAICDIEVLQDPGYGFMEAAINALDGVECVPAEVNGFAVAAKFRYPIRFTLN